MAILQLIDQGKLHLDDSVATFFPSFPYPAITLRHLLSHMSGLPPYNTYFPMDSGRDTVFTDADFMAGLSAHPAPLRYQPGDGGNYDNINCIVLAEILVKVSGESYADYIAAHLLQPAGMSHTVFLPLCQQLESAARRGRFAFPHLRFHQYSSVVTRASSVPYIRQYWCTYRFNGFGDYVGTTLDLLRFDDALYSGKLVEPRLLALAFHPGLMRNGRPNPENFGLGWELDPDTSLGTVVYHSGYATGLSAVLLRNVTRHQTVIVFDNTHDNAHEVGTAFLRLMNGRAVPVPKRSLTERYGETLVAHGVQAARRTLARFRGDTAEYSLTEGDMNALGYDLMGQPSDYRVPLVHRYRDAEEVLRQNTVLFPSSANVWDSYGEVLLKNGRKAEALRMYERALDLNPGSKNARLMVDSLSRATRP
jgi:hypothetical protein